MTTPYVFAIVLIAAIFITGLILNHHGKFKVTIPMISFVGVIFIPIQIWNSANPGVILHLVAWIVITSFLTYNKPKLKALLIVLHFLAFILCILIIKFRFSNITINGDEFTVLMIHVISSTLSMAIAIGYLSSLYRKQQLKMAQLNNIKDKMISIITHDLRSPIYNLQGLIEHSETNFDNPDQIKAFMTKIKKELKTTSELMEDVLTWVKGQLTDIKPNKISFDVKELINYVIQVNQSTVEKKNIKVRLTGEPLMLYADKEMIHLGIRNIYANAIKFSPSQNGIINIEIEKLNNYGVIKISDNGIGLNKKEIDLICKKQPFTNMGTAKEKGFGLGLILTVDFLEKNEGKLQITSEKGKGASFSLIIPLA